MAPGRSIVFGSGFFAETWDSPADCVTNGNARMNPNAEIKARRKMVFLMKSFALGEKVWGQV